MVTSKVEFDRTVRGDDDFACNAYTVGGPVSVQDAAFVLATHTKGLCLDWALNYALMRLRDDGILQSVYEEQLSRPDLQSVCASRQQTGKSHQPIDVRAMSLPLGVNLAIVVCVFLFAIVKKFPRIFPSWMRPRLPKAKRFLERKASLTTALTRRSLSRNPACGGTSSEAANTSEYVVSDEAEPPARCRPKHVHLAPTVAQHDADSGTACHSRGRRFPATTTPSTADLTVNHRHYVNGAELGMASQSSQVPPAEINILAHRRKTTTTPDATTAALGAVPVAGNKLLPSNSSQKLLKLFDDDAVHSGS
jgi:hypothetical protein